VNPTAAATRRRRSPTAPRRSPARRRSRRGRLLRPLAILAVAGAVVTWMAGRPPFDDAVQEVTLPLRHDDVIRQQAEDKDLDPALIAAVIYQETGFRPRASPAGAQGLMQIMPSTARFIARRSGGTEFELRDLDTPQINIAYGSWYLRYLLDRYEGDEALALAAYNAGMTNVDSWVGDAGGRDDFHLSDVPFPETRAYVRGVLTHRTEYRERWGDELGL
jgi:soluble lytic murein transglycosylase